MGCVPSKSTSFKTKGLPGLLVYYPNQRLLLKDYKWDGLEDKISSSLIEKIKRARGQVAATLLSAARHNDYETVVRAVEEYVPLLLGLCQEGLGYEDAVDFGWVNTVSGTKETILKSARYEFLSVLYALALTRMQQGNASLEVTVSESAAPKAKAGARVQAQMELLTAAGILQFATLRTGVSISPKIRSSLPVDLSDGVLQALQHQCIAQVAELQIVIEADSMQLRRDIFQALACQAMQHWQQAVDCLGQVKEGNEEEGDWGKKHKAFLKWRLLDAKAVAYYYHGLVLDGGTAPNTHAIAVSCFKAAERSLRDGMQAMREFGKTEPKTRATPFTGPMSYLVMKIPREAMSKARINKDVFPLEKEPDKAPDPPVLPDIIDLPPYVLPSVDPAWLMDVKSKPPGNPPPSVTTTVGDAIAPAKVENIVSESQRSEAKVEGVAEAQEKQEQVAIVS